MKSKSKLETRRMKVSLSAIVQQYAADLRLRNRSPRTIQLYTNILGHFGKHLQTGQPGAEAPISSVTLENARDYITALMERETVFVNHPLRKAREQKLSPFTIHQHVRILHAFGSWLKHNGYPNQLSEVQYPKLPKRLIEVLTEEEIGKLFNIYNPETPFGARWQAMVAFFLQSGVRLSELLGLSLDRLELDKYRARIIGKGNKERYVPFGTRAHQTLSLYINLYRPQTSHSQVFLNLDGTLPTVSTVEHIIKNARNKSGITKLHTHLFRHTFSTNYLLAGGNVFDLQDILGHEDLEMTRRYVHLAQVLSRTGTQLEHMQRRVALVDEMPGLKPSHLEESGSRKRGVDGKFSTQPPNKYIR